MEYDGVVAFTLFKMAKLLPAMDKSIGIICIISSSHTRKQVTFETIRVLLLKNKKKLRIKLRTIETESEKNAKKRTLSLGFKVTGYYKKSVFWT